MAVGAPGATVPTRTVAADRDLGLRPPVPVPRPMMVHRWQRVGFVHRPYEPHLVQRLLPPGLEVDRFDGAAWIGIIPFRLEVRLPPWWPAIPWATTTLETNLRTYVRGPDGRRGIYFFYLDASRLIPVLAARAWYGIPYRWSRLRFERRGRVIRYQSLRREPVGAHLDLRLAVGERVAHGELSDLERFLVCRWRLYSPWRGTVAVTEVDHDPWPLHRADVAGLDEGITAAVGLPPERSGPVAHYAPEVEVKFRRRRTVGTQ